MNFLRAMAALAVPALMMQIPADAQTPAPPAAAQVQAAGPQIPDPEGILILIRSSLLAVTQANATGNYTVLRDLGSPAFHAANPASRLSQIFGNLRDQRLDLSPVAIVTPELTVPPAIEQGMLRLKGSFPTRPLSVVFDLLFQPVDGQWRLFGISVGTVQAAAPASPASATAAPSPTSAPKKPSASGKP